VLADEATRMCRGTEAAAAARATAQKTFVEGGLGADLPVIEMPKAELEAGIAAFALLVRAGLAASNGEARRIIKGAGAKLNDETIADENRKISLSDLNAEGVIKLSFGKKKHVVVKPS
jgi:tyrosyl-tRNA synthetase